MIRNEKADEESKKSSRRFAAQPDNTPTWSTDLLTRAKRRITDLRNTPDKPPREARFGDYPEKLVPLPRSQAVRLVRLRCDLTDEFGEWRRILEIDEDMACRWCCPKPERPADVDEDEDLPPYRWKRYCHSMDGLLCCGHDYQRTADFAVHIARYHYEWLTAKLHDYIRPPRLRAEFPVPEEPRTDEMPQFDLDDNGLPVGLVKCPFCGNVVPPQHLAQCKTRKKKKPKPKAAAHNAGKAPAPAAGKKAAPAPAGGKKLPMTVLCPHCDEQKPPGHVAKCPKKEKPESDDEIDEEPKVRPAPQGESAETFTHVFFRCPKLAPLREEFSDMFVGRNRSEVIFRLGHDLRALQFLDRAKELLKEMEGRLSQSAA